MSAMYTKDIRRYAITLISMKTCSILLKWCYFQNGSGWYSRQWISRHRYDITMRNMQWIIVDSIYDRGDRQFYIKTDMRMHQIPVLFRPGTTTRPWDIFSSVVLQAHSWHLICTQYEYMLRYHVRSYTYMLWSHLHKSYPGQIVFICDHHCCISFLIMGITQMRKLWMLTSQRDNTWMLW